MMSGRTPRGGPSAQISHVKLLGMSDNSSMIPNDAILNQISLHPKKREKKNKKDPPSWDRWQGREKGREEGKKGE